MTLTRVPRTLEATELMRHSERLLATGPTLLNAVNDDEIAAVTSAKNTELHTVRRLLAELKVADELTPMLTEIDVTIDQLAANLDEIGMAVTRRDEATSQKNALLRNAFAASRAFARTWSSHFEEVQKNVVALERTASAPTSDAKQRLGDIDQAMLSILPLDQLQRRAADSFQLLVGGANADDPKELARLKISSEAAMREIDGLMSGVDLETSTALLPDIKLLRESALGSGGLFAVKEAELDANVEGRRLIAENERLSNRLSEAMEAFVGTSRRQMEFAAGNAVSVQTASSSALALIALLSLLSSVLIVWLYVGRNIVSRLSRLGSGMRAIAAGDRDVTVPTHGADEIAAMGRAVEVFRQNAIERDALLDERADAAERLEGVVEQRTAELRDTLDQQQAIAQLLQVINASPGNLAPVFDEMLDKALRLCGAAFGSFWTCQSGLFDAVATRNRPAVLGELQSKAYKPGPDTALGCLAAGERFVHGDAAEHDSYRSGRPACRALVNLAGARTYLAVPLRKGDELLGAFAIYRQEIRPFTEKQIALMESFADQAVIAMENARLLGEIRQRQAELQVTFDNMAHGVAMFDGQLQLAAWNRNFQEILDLPKTFFGKPRTYAEFIRFLAQRGEFGAGTDPDAELRRYMENALRHYAFERARPNGRVLEIRHNPMPKGGFVLIYSDITDRKRADAEIRAAKDAAEDASRTIEAAYRDLQAAQANLVHAQKMAALGQLTAGIAHEIKNPLNFVNNFAGLSVELLDELKATAAPGIAALDDGTRAEIDETVAMLTSNLEKIVEHGGRADGIVKSMLAHSRGGSGDRQSANVNALIEEALNLAYHGARAQDQEFNITLQRDLDPAAAPVELVPQDVTRVFLNLFGNGFYAANKRWRSAAAQSFQPMLRVATRDLGDAVEVRVRDNGTGIPPEIKDKLFQPFFTTKPTGEGTGLGLSISYDIVVQQHGGTIAVDSEVGEFTEFTITLPRERQVMAVAG